MQVKCLAQGHSATAAAEARTQDLSVRRRSSQSPRHDTLHVQYMEYIFEMYWYWGWSLPGSLVVISGSLVSHSMSVRRRRHLHGRWCEPQEMHSLQCWRARIISTSLSRAQRGSNPGPPCDRRTRLRTASNKVESHRPLQVNRNGVRPQRLTLCWR